MATTQKKRHKHVHATAKKREKNLLKRRLLVTALLVFIAGISTMFAFVWTRDSKADTAFDPFYAMNTASPEVKVFQPLHKSVDNSGDFVASGQAPAGSTVNISVDGVSYGTTTANDRGLWSKNISGIADGDHQLTASSSVSGPLMVVTSQNYAPGYGLIDVSNNSLQSAYNVGLSAVFFGSIGSFASSDPVTTYEITTPSGSPYVYMVRQRSIAVVDTRTQKIAKAINLGPAFNNGSGDTGEYFKKSVLSGDGSALYLLFSNGGSSRLVKVDLTTNQLVSPDNFNPALAPDAQQITSAQNKLYISAPGQQAVTIVDLANNGAVSSVEASSPVRAIVASPSGETVYISEGQDGGPYAVSKLSTSSDAITESQVMDLGSNYPATELYVRPDGQKLYAQNSSATSEVRVYDTTSNSQDSTIMLEDRPRNNADVAAKFNEDGTRLFIALENRSVSVVDTNSNAVTGKIDRPSNSYDSIADINYYNNKIYIGYNRTFDPADIVNPQNLFKSLAVAPTNNGNATAQPLPSVGTATTAIAGPVTITQQTYSGASDFSVGEPISITSPVGGEALETSVPTFTGKGPKNKTIQLLVNTNNPIDVQVDGDGNWQKQVALPKDKFSKVTAVYNNKRTQIAIPTHTIMGNNTAQTQLEIVDGDSALSQEPVFLAQTSTSSVQLNNGAAINPNGQRYYLVSSDFSSIVQTLLESLTSGSGGSSTDTMIMSALDQLTTTSLGRISVYSAQTKDLKQTVNMPAGVIPIGMSVSPDGKKAIITAFDINAQKRLLTGEEPADESTPAPFAMYRMNLGENNTLNPTSTRFNLNLAGFNDSQNVEAFTTSILGAVSGVQILSRPGSFNADGSKFYTTALAAGKIGVVDVASGQASTLDISANYSMGIVMSTFYNKTNGYLYATVINPTSLSDGTSIPQVIPSLIIIDPQTNAIIGQSVLPEFPLLSFAVSKDGMRAYFLTANISDFIESLDSTGSNAGGLLAETLPQFSVSVYDLNGGTFNSYPISNTEVPIALTMSPDESKLFIPTVASTVVHTFDTATNEVDAGNAPITLRGLSIMLGNADFVSDAVIGSYTAQGDYYVPADPPVDCCVPPPVDPKVVNVGSTQFRYLTAAQQAAVQPQSIKVPTQTTKIVAETVQQAVERERQAQAQSVQRNWLVYIFYGALMTVLTAIGVTIWRTDTLLGGGAAQDVFA